MRSMLLHAWNAASPISSSQRLMEPIIRVQDLGKQYHLGGPAAAYSTLRETIMELARKPLRSLTRNGNASPTWALKDMDFEIAAAELVGIVGCNGAGKSMSLRAQIVEAFP